MPSGTCVVRSWMETRQQVSALDSFQCSSLSGQHYAVCRRSVQRPVHSLPQETADLTVDKTVAPEAMGVHIATAVSMQTDIPLVVIRKRPYGLNGEVSLHHQTGYSESEMYINDVEVGDRLLVVDDMFSTGGTLAAICNGLSTIGADIVDIVVVMRKVGPSALDETPYKTTNLLDITVEDGDVIAHE